MINFKRVFISLTLIFTSFEVFAINKVIYGDDDRLDFNNSQDGMYRSLADSTFAIIKKVMLKPIRDGKAFAFSKKVKSLKDQMSLCPGEKFGAQPAAAHCSAFLIGPDLVMTAGHCVEDLSKKKTIEEICAENFLAIDYKESNPDNPFEIEFPKKNVFSCKRVLVNKYERRGLDYAIIQLDRPVYSVRPLELRTEGKLAIGDGLAIIGYPWGIPGKIADNATVLNNSDDRYFGASLDSFQGNSGSAVFNAQTGLVEGILVRGKTDYVIKTLEDGKKCVALNYCNDEGGETCEVNGGSLDSEEVTRITTIKDAIEEARRKSLEF